MLIKKNANRNWKEKVPSFPAFETPHNKKPAVKKKKISPGFLKQEIKQQV